MLEIIQSCTRVDDIKYSTSLEQITNNYEHLTNCDPYQDTLFAEVNGLTIGYSRVFWEKLNEGIRVYNSFGNILPEWRGRGIGTAMLGHNEKRLRQIAVDHPLDDPRFFQSWAADTEEETNALLRSQENN